MHEGNVRVVIALPAVQIGEQGGHFRGDVLVDAMQAHQRVKQDEVRPEKSHGRLQGLLVFFAIESQRRHGEDMDIELWNSTPAALAMPWRRPRTTCGASSAANGKTRPARGIWK
jgi:hypothetical protein